MKTYNADQMEDQCSRKINLSNGLIKFQEHKYLENKLMLSGVHK